MYSKSLLTLYRIFWKKWQEIFLYPRAQNPNIKPWILNSRVTILLDHPFRELLEHRSQFIRPTVRGVVMNPVDHPHGGGEGKAPIGGKPQTPWGMPAMGYKTRRGRKPSDKFIVKKRTK